MEVFQRQKADVGNPIVRAKTESLNCMERTTDGQAFLMGGERLKQLVGKWLVSVKNELIAIKNSNRKSILSLKKLCQMPRGSCRKKLEILYLWVIERA